MKSVSKLYVLLMFCAALAFISCGNKGKTDVANEVEDTTAIVSDTSEVMENVAPIDPSIQTQTPEVKQEEVKPVDTNPITETDKVAVVDSTVAANTQVTKTTQESTGASFSPSHSVSGSKLICLTFDDGPSNKTTPKILDTMQKYGAHCTFFCVGSCITESTKHNLSRAESLGCEVANHTYNHPNLTKCSKSKQIDELNKTNEKIRGAIGHYPVFFRPPYLACNKSVLSGLGLVSISGSSSDDWVTSKSPSRIVEDVMKLAKDGAIIVMHDLGANSRTPVALETLVPRLQAEGFTLVTVSELFSAKGQTPQLERTYTSVR